MTHRWLHTAPLALLAGLSAVAASACTKAAPPDEAASPALITPKGPTPARHAMAADGALQLDPEDHCPVCGMLPHKHPKFAAGLSLRDGRTFYTCGTGCLLRSWLHPEVYLGVPREAITRAVVQDYFSGAPLDADAAYWVAGSDVVGPMGPALVPLRSSADADTFVARHGGAQRFRLSELDDARWQQITGKRAVPPARTTR